METSPIEVEESYVITGELPEGGFGSLVRILLGERMGAAMFFRTKAHAEMITAGSKSNLVIVKFSEYLSSDHPAGKVTNALLLTDEQLEKYLANRSVEGFEKFVFQVKL